MITYYDESILSYIASIRGYFGLSSSYNPNSKFSNLINSKKPKKVILFVVDAMGANLINKKLPEDSFLRKNIVYKTRTVFPSTTTSATTSIRNGKAPCENGWIGWIQYIKEIDDEIIPFHGRGFYNDKQYDKDLMYKIAPVTFIEDELNRIGVKARILFPSFMEDGCEDIDSMCKRLIGLNLENEYKFIYAYWDKYDTYMHEYGPSSKICDAYLNHINYEIENLANNLDDETMLIVTADHGQIDVKEEYNICGSKYDKYLYRKPALEPRAMTFYVKDGMQDEFEKTFKQEFEDRFVLLTHKQALDMNLFGDRPYNERFEEFIGDFIAIGKANTILAYKEELTPSMKGQHAGMTDDEMLVPIIVYQK